MHPAAGARQLAFLTRLFRLSCRHIAAVSPSNWVYFVITADRGGSYAVTFAYNATVNQATTAGNADVYVGTALPSCFACTMDYYSYHFAVRGAPLTYGPNAAVATVSGPGTFVVRLVNTWGSWPLVGTLSTVMMVSAAPTAAPTFAAEPVAALDANVTDVLPTEATYRYYRVTPPTTGSYRAEVWFDVPSGSVVVHTGATMPVCATCWFDSMVTPPTPTTSPLPGYAYADYYVSHAAAVSAGFIVRLQRTIGAPNYRLRVRHIASNDVTGATPSVTPSVSYTSTVTATPSTSPGFVSGTTSVGVPLTVNTREWRRLLLHVCRPSTGMAP